MEELPPTAAKFLETLEAQSSVGEEVGAFQRGFKCRAAGGEERA